MTEQELERRLRDYYRAETNGEAASGSLLATITAIPERQPASPFVGGRGLLLLFAAGLILALLAGTALAVGSGLVQLPWQDSPNLINQAPTSPVPSPTTAALLPSLAPATPALPSASLLPISIGAWTTLDLQPIGVGPPASVWMVHWSGGYLALHPTGGGFLESCPPNAGPLDAWVSRDGRSWTTLPSQTFGTHVCGSGVAPIAGGVIVITASPDATVWLSTDGTTWTSSPAPLLNLVNGERLNDVAGGPGGVVALSGSVPAMSGSYGLDFSADGQAWQNVALPGSDFSIAGVEAFGTRFVAYGTSGSNKRGNPVAWWSDDGLHWTAADPITRPGEGFIQVQAGSGGLVAIGAGNPFDIPADPQSLWSSPDGRSWSLLGQPLVASGEGTSGGGYLRGDGERLLWYSDPASLPTAYLTSLDGTSWTKLNLTGDTSAATAGQTTPFLTQDGVLFIGTNGLGKWFGSPGN